MLTYIPNSSVTSVGATQGFSPETAAPFSAGGFSNLFPAPSYQASAISAYLSSPAITGSNLTGLFNTTGRGFPDVSAQGVGFSVVVAGQQLSVDGTSASAPTFASIIALLSIERVAAGYPPLGFLNQLLYSLPAGTLNDITQGSNPGCGTNGFPVIAGWDPVRALQARSCGM